MVNELHISVEISSSKDRFNIILQNNRIEVSKMNLTVFLTFIIRLRRELDLFVEKNLGESFNITSVMFDYSADVYIDNIIVFGNGSFTVKMNYNDVYELAQDSYDILNSLYPVSELDYRILDEVYLEHMLGIDLPFLKSCSFKECFLEKLFLFSHNEFKWKKIIRSELYLSLRNDIVPKNFSEMNLHSQNEIQRMQSVLNIMKNNNYGKDGRYIIIYNDTKMVKDGSHRAVSLLYLYGNIKVKVMVLNFEKNFHSYNYFLAKGGKPEW